MSKLPISVCLLLVLLTITHAMGNAAFPKPQQPQMKFEPMGDLKNLKYMKITELIEKSQAEEPAKTNHIFDEKFRKFLNPMMEN